MSSVPYSWPRQHSSTAAGTLDVAWLALDFPFGTVLPDGSPLLDLILLRSRSMSSGSALILLLRLRPVVVVCRLDPAGPRVAKARVPSHSGLSP